MMYKAVVQAVLMHGSEIWVVTEVMMTVLEVFHHRTAGQIVRIIEQRGDGREYEWALVDAALEVTGIWPMRDYVMRCQVKIAEYVSGRLM